MTGAPIVSKDVLKEVVGENGRPGGAPGPARDCLVQLQQGPFALTQDEGSAGGPVTHLGGLGAKSSDDEVDPVVRPRRDSERHFASR